MAWKRICNKISVWAYKWLPIICGCHCRPERSFFYKKKQFPVCARCTGELLGFLAGIATYWWVHPTMGVSCLLLIPLIVDGVLQLSTSYQSKNWLRLISGLLFGYGLLVLFFSSIVYVFLHGYRLGLVLINS